MPKYEQKVFSVNGPEAFAGSYKNMHYVEPKILKSTSSYSTSCKKLINPKF
jgi:hypothetical protein